MNAARKIALLKIELEHAKRERLAEMRAKIEATQARIQGYQFRIEKQHQPK